MAQQNVFDSNREVLASFMNTITIFQAVQILYAFFCPLACGISSVFLLSVLLVVGLALSQTEYDTRPKLITPVSATENGKHETAHTETKTDAAGDCFTTTITPLAVPSPNIYASTAIHQNNIYTSLLADEDVLEVVGSDNNL